MIINIFAGWLFAYLLAFTPLNEMIQKTFHLDYTGYTVAFIVTWVVAYILRGIVVIERD